MIYLDTNAFYYASNIERVTSIDIDKLQNIVSKNSTAISSVTLFEFLTKYHHNLDKIHQGGKFICTNNIQISFNKYFEIPNGKLSLIQNISHITMSELKDLYNDILKIKIDTESRLTSIVAHLCFFSGVYFSTFSKVEKPSELAVELFMRINEEASKIALYKFMQEYEIGYNTTSCEKHIREQFYWLLEFLFEYFIPLIDRALLENDNTLINEFLRKDINWADLISQQLKKINKCPSSTAYLTKIARQYWNESSDDNLYEYMKKIVSPVNKMVPEKALQDYIYDIVYNCCTTNGAFYKNNILDAIIVCNLQNENKLITYDNGMIKHMERHKDSNKLYRDSLALINDLR